MPKGCWWDGTNQIHPWSKQPESPPSKLPLLTCFMNCKPPKAKPVLSQGSIIANSCSKGNSLLTAHGILQPRVALEGRDGTACMRDEVLPGLRFPSGPLRRLRAKNHSRAPDKGRKSPKKAEAAENKSPPALKHSHQPSPSGQTRELGPTGSQPTLQQHQGAAWESCTTRAHTAWRGAGQPPFFYPGAPTIPSLFPKRDCPAGWSGIPTAPEPRTATLAHKLLH